MALDMTPEQKAVGQANFQRVVGKLAEDFVGGNGAHGFLQTWPRRASISSAAAGPQVPAG